MPQSKAHRKIALLPIFVSSYAKQILEYTCRILNLIFRSQLKCTTTQHITNRLCKCLDHRTSTRVVSQNIKSIACKRRCRYYRMKKPDFPAIEFIYIVLWAHFYSCFDKRKNSQKYGMESKWMLCNLVFLVRMNRTVF